MTNPPDVNALTTAGAVPPGTECVRGTAYEVVTGGFNETPHELTEIDLKRFARFMLSTGIKAVEFRQAPLAAGSSALISLRMLHLAGGIGIAMCEDSAKDSARFFRFGYAGACAHSWRLEDTGNCYTKRVCVKCGLKDTTDSTG